MYIMKGLEEWYKSSPKTEEFTKVCDYYNKLTAEFNQPINKRRGIVLPIEMNIRLEEVK